MQNKSETHFKKYLQNIPNEQLIQFYDDLEWTPFPILVLKEHQRRFNTKNKKEVLEKLKNHAEMAMQYSSSVSKKIRSRSVITSKRNLELIEKLAELNTKGIITKKDFQNKKAELLKRI